MVSVHAARDVWETAKLDGWNEGRAEGRAEGLAEGRAEGRAEVRASVAIKMKELGLDVDMIIQATGLSREEIEAL